MMVETDFVNSEKEFPLVVRPKADDLDLCSWSGSNRQWIQDRLLDYGAILFRGFDVGTVDRLSRFADSLTDEVVEYKERRSPRTLLGKKVYTSTIHPSDQEILFHNTTSFSHQWPLKVWFCCLRPPDSGGMTPIADCRRVLEHIDPTLREKFVDKGVMYVRNFHQGIGLPWQATFQTTDIEEVERYCRDAQIHCEWVFGGSRLRTRQVRHAVATHPVTGACVWFNQAYHFHIMNLPLNVRQGLLDTYAEEDLPRNAYFGDGSRISTEELAEIGAAYEAERVAFEWQKGDVLMLDNMLAAHARTSYEGDRLIALMLAEQYSPPNYHERPRTGLAAA
jgi:alpha-ketoglutarate-dependent taurine dioxygenase